MSTKPPQSQEAENTVSPTAKTTADTMGLGRTSGQRGAEILAGIRAELTPSPITKALSRYTGQLAARMMIKLLGRGSGIAGMNFVAVRTSGFSALIKEAVTDIESNLTIVEIAAGFSPRGFELAQTLSHARVIEIDLPDVVEQKQSRLRRVRGMGIPDNLIWYGADMGTVTLRKILDNRAAHAISAEGLLPYFPRAEQVAICRQIYENLTEGGLFIADFSWRPGLNMAREGTMFFSRQAGNIAGLVDSPEDVEGILQDAGFDEVSIEKPSALAERFQLPTPVLDFQLIAVGRKRTNEKLDGKLPGTVAKTIEVVTQAAASAGKEDADYEPTEAEGQSAEADNTLVDPEQ